MLNAKKPPQTIAFVYCELLQQTKHNLCATQLWIIRSLSNHVILTIELEANYMKNVSRDMSRWSHIEPSMISTSVRDTDIADKNNLRIDAFFPFCSPTVHNNAIEK